LISRMGCPFLCLPLCILYATRPFIDAPKENRRLAHPTFENAGGICCDEDNMLHRLGSWLTTAGGRRERLPSRNAGRLCARQSLGEEDAM